MAVFAGGLWFVYVEGRDTQTAPVKGGVPLIRADAPAEKVKPENPGGMAITDHDMLIYARGRGRARSSTCWRRPNSPARPAPPRSAGRSHRPPEAPASCRGRAGRNGPDQRRSRTPLPLDRNAARPESLKRRRRVAAPRRARRRAVRRRRGRDGAGKAGGVRLQLGSVRSEGMARVEWAPHQSRRTRPARQAYGDRGPHRSRRQRRLLSHRDRAGRRQGARRADLCEAAASSGASSACNPLAR